MTTTTSVLVVEDEDSFIDALTVGLTREGFRVSVARDGAEALDMFDDVDPDLVLLDVMLPKVSGIDVCRELRSRSSVPTSRSRRGLHPPGRGPRRRSQAQTQGTTST